VTQPAQGPHPANPEIEQAPRIGPTWQADSYHVGPRGSASGKPGSARKIVMLSTAVVFAVALAIGGVALTSSSKSASPKPVSHPISHRKSHTGISTAPNPAIIPHPAINMSALHLVGGPVASDGRLLVINVTASRSLELSAIDPATETVVWQRPFSASGITPGEPFPPSAFGDIAIDFSPTPDATSVTGQILGIDIATGAVAWTYSGSGVTGDAPVACGGPNTFCLSWASGITQGLIEVDATNGSLLRTIPNVERDLGTNLYQGNETNPTLIQIGRQGQMLWQASASSAFGTVNDNPDSGWDVDPFGSLDVGSLGPAVVPQTSIDFSSATTSGFAIATGRPVWTDAGLYNCSGSLEIFSTPTLCRVEGTVTRTSSGGVSTAGVTVTLEGFDTQTGKVTWSQPDQNLTGLIGTGALPFEDGYHIVIKQRGTDLILDLATGEVRPVSSGLVFWCATTPTVQVLAPAGSGYPNERSATDQFFGCNAAGAAVSTDPADQPPLVGVILGGKFFWPTPHGLQVAPAA
jgi:hypothetical protein